jgi:DNA-binding CsgD family transcriptional regulator
MEQQPEITCHAQPLKSPHTHVCVNFDLFSRHMLNAMACCEMIYNKRGKPVNFRYIRVNEAYTRLTGLSDVAGKTVLDVLPSLKKDNPEIFEHYGKVARTGQPVKYEVHVKSLNIWLKVSAHCPQKGYFISIFENISHLKNAIEEIAHQKDQLYKTNLALSLLIEQISFEKQKIKNDFSRQIAQNVSPLVDKIKLHEQKNRYVDLLKDNLHKIIQDTDIPAQKARLGNLSAREMEVCQMIKNHLSSKEISSLIGISVQTVCKHRRNIRKKFGITNQDINLATFLYHLT